MVDVEDVMDRGPRLKRGVLCLMIGLACAVTVYGLLDELARPETAVTDGPYRFIGYFTGLAFVVPIVAAWTILSSRARKQWRRKRLPEARVR